MPLPVSFYNITIADNTAKSTGEPETTSGEVPIITLTPANVAATATLCGNLKTALAGLVLGRFVADTLVYDRAKNGANIPADDDLAQRENKWLCRYHDATTFQKFSVSYGTADLSKHKQNSEFVDLTTGAGAAFKTAFEAVVVSPADSTHTVVLDSMQFVGRNR
jgi:hypothetical protein